MKAEFAMVQPSEVCRVMALFALSLTPSMISISIVRPIGTKQPERGPCAANSAWHVGNIKSEQTIGVGCIARDAHAVSAGSVGNVGAIDTHVDKAVVGVDIAILGCCVLIDIVHITGSGIG